MKNRSLLIFLISMIILLFFSIGGTVVFYNIFKLKKVEIEKNFDMDNRKITKYLNLEIGQFLFSYNIKNMEEKLEILPSIRDFSVKLELPDTIKISIFKIMPIAMSIDSNDTIYYLDQSGKALKDLVIKTKVPLIITDNKRESEKNNNLQHVIKVLAELKKTNTNIYEKIEKIEIKETNRPLCDYFVNYWTIEQVFYLKNILNVDLLREGFLVSLYIDENNFNPKRITYNSFGFIF